MADDNASRKLVMKLFSIFGPMAVVALVAAIGFWASAPSTYANKEEVHKIELKVKENSGSFKHISETLELMQDTQKSAMKSLDKTIQSVKDDLKEDIQELRNATN